MAQIQTIIQLNETDLENKIKSMYKNVAQRPDDMYHFQLGKNLAIKLGYPENILEKISGPAIDSFANYYALFLPFRLLSYSNFLCLVQLMGEHSEFSSCMWILYSCKVQKTLVI